MWHPLLSPFHMVTLILCLQQAASSHAEGTGPGGLALAVCPGLTEGKMAAGPALGLVHTAPSALSPPSRRAKAPPGEQDGHEITTSSPGFGDVAPGKGEIKGGPMAAFIMEVNTRLRRRTCQAEQETSVLPDECCFWSHILWSFSHHACRCLCQNLDLLYYRVILPFSKVTSILVAITAGIQLLARYRKSYQSRRESKEQWPEYLLRIVWGAADCSDCAICLQAYQPGEALKLLSCRHAYHSTCIDRWHRAQRRRKTCPLCLRSVTAVVLIPLTAQYSEHE